MKILVIGAGRIGRCIATDASKWATVGVCDSNKEALEQINSTANSPLHYIKSITAIEPILNKYNLAISCVPYRFNYYLTKLCIKNKVSMIDFGGNTGVVMKQLSMNADAKRKKVTIVPDCGLAPGLTNVLAGDLIRKGFTNIEIRVGGIPQDPNPPLYYEQLFSIYGLVNEYISPVTILQNRKIRKTKPLLHINSIDLSDILKN
ncbi:MAG: saccharopine dehydrogenase NADP-binding domain-containing protein, partial [Planctomycetes bacterium]|nr:saccharopine dehydrogenase NADP-binding domain-containing protein [Planctomycetota bacterium]